MTPTKSDPGKEVSEEELKAAEELADTIVNAPKGYISYAAYMLARAFLHSRRSPPADSREREEAIEECAKVLKEHWLAYILCDHENKTDTPSCACSLWLCDPQPTIGAAVDRWIEHVMRQLPVRRGPPRDLRGEALEIIRGFLQCPEIADCAPDDKDSETDALERRARALLKSNTPRKGEGE